ncbi:hypothetical protein BKA65DRAFT_537778 [Rhexocercosporidium sp. MPI-PUGE-AT-0058]|nr:hypothetical protein BKA65DRAFT_537778 [Rhexocercosporidium sp. MPI-PUGE-AT-0058]
MNAETTSQVQPAQLGVIHPQNPSLASKPSPTQQPNIPSPFYRDNVRASIQQSSLTTTVAIPIEQPIGTIDPGEDDAAISQLIPLTSEGAHALGLPPLDFKPFMLRRWFLCASLGFNLLILGLMITLLFKPKFKVLNQWGYFFIQIFPAVVGTITASFLRGITVTLSRITPFILCASPSGATAGKTILREYFPDPSMTDAFQTKSFILSFAWILFIIGSFILGFKASLLNTDLADGYREAIVATWALYPLICIYTFVALFMVAVIVKMELASSTGLRWDPVSLADHLVLFRHSNFLRFFEGTDMATRDSMHEILKGLPLRLGYWIRTDGDASTSWHGFGLLESGIDQLEHRIQSERVWKLSHKSAENLLYRSTYSNMKRVSMYIWTTIAFILCGLFITGLLTNMVDGYDIPFSANWAAFLFQFVLTFVVSQFTWFWEDLDLFTRSTQPFLHNDIPQPAAENLLLDYNCALPYIVTYTALTNRHWKVARISALAPLQRLLPILVGGSISVVDNGNYTCKCSASLPLFIVIIIWLFTYIILIPYEILEAGNKRHLPRNYCSIADIVSWTYANKLLNQGDLFKIDLEDDEKRTRWYFQAKLQLACKKYLFGMYKSSTRDGVYCMGIDEDSNDAMSISPPVVRELSWLPGLRRRSRNGDGGEKGQTEKEDFVVSADLRWTFLFNVRADSNNSDINTVQEVRHE